MSPTRTRVTGVLAALVASALVLGACSEDSSDGGGAPPRSNGGGDGGAAGEPTSSVSPSVVGTVAEDLEVPWGLDFLPDGDALVTERDSGRVLRVGADGGTREVGTVPGVSPNGEGGLLGLAVSPDFASDRAVYVYLTTDTDNRILRFTLDGDDPGSITGDGEVILDGIPFASFHDGGRMVFGPDGLLYVGTGEAGVPDRSQDRDSLGGKILRMTPDGDVPDDNPFDGSLVYSYGHRNVQGLAFDSDGRLWASEFGQNTWDELNLVRPGRNYGWPEVEGIEGDSRFVDPLRQWSTAEASPSGIAYAEGAVYMAGLRGERLWQIPVQGTRAGEPQAFSEGEYGRLRTVAAAPDGTLWLTTSNADGRGDPESNDDRILRVRLN